MDFFKSNGHGRRVYSSYLKDSIKSCDYIWLSGVKDSIIMIVG